MGGLSSNFMLNSDSYTEFFYQAGFQRQKNLNVQNCTNCANETGRNFHLRCRGLSLSPVFGVRYIPIHFTTIVCQHSLGSLALVLLYLSHNLSPCSSLTSPRFYGNKNPSVTTESGFSDSYYSIP
jgi:hypothetical protein